MKKVVIESPYAGDVAMNTEYARRAMADCLRRGEAPFASHLLYTQPGILDDTIPEERKLGIDAGLIYASDAELTAVYCDLGITKGMMHGIKTAFKCERPIEVRMLNKERSLGEFVYWKTFICLYIRRELSNV